MERAELIRFDKQGRLKLLSLTKNGVDVADNIEKIKNML
jgi:predicted transcriptional regulator